MAGRSARGEGGNFEMLREINRIVFVALPVIISACQIQPVTYYTPPEEVALEDSATMVGSMVRIRNIFYGDEITYVYAIDDLPVEGGSKNHDVPLQLSPGKHVVQVGFAQGWTGCAKASFELIVESRKTYITRAEKLGRESLFSLENIRIWIEDSAEDAVTDDAVVPFNYCGSGFGLIVY